MENSQIPDAKELGSLAGRRRLAFSGETAHVVNGQDGGRDEPWRAEKRADRDLKGNHQQVKVVPGTFLSTTQQSRHADSRAVFSLTNRNGKSLANLSMYVCIRKFITREFLQPMQSRGHTKKMCL